MLGGWVMIWYVFQGKAGCKGKVSVRATKLFWGRGGGAVGG